ncbi:MAG: TonB-dependent receptor [Pseudomonadales bacterium]
MNTTTRSRYVLSLLAAFTGIAHAPAGLAQQALLEEIIVTAERRETGIQETPIAVTAFAQDELDRLGISETMDLGSFIPNVFIGRNNNRDSVLITIRGVSSDDQRNESDPTTAFHVDGVYIPRMSGANAHFHDLERVEVLRGPQGTLFGRNATAGVVNLVARRPEDAFGASLDLTLGNFDRVRTRGHVNVPLIDDQLAFRVAFITEDREGYRNNDPAPQRGDDADDWSVRAQLQWQPAEAFTALLAVDTFRRRGVGPVNGFIDFPGNPNPGFVLESPRRFPLAVQGRRDDSDFGVRLDLEWQLLPEVTVNYLGSYREHDRDALSDLDGALQSDSLVGEVFDSEVISHELRIAGAYRQRLQWQAGVFYLEEEIDSVFNIQIPAAPFIPFDRLDFDFVDNGQTNESYAGFGQLDFNLNDQWAVVAGLRYTKDEKKKSDSFQEIRRINSAGPPPLTILPQNISRNWSETTWRVGINYTPSDDLLTYATVSTGYKAGGFNRGESLAEYDPETILAYEIGLKHDFFDGRARVNAAAFYYDYEDLQQSQTEIQPDGSLENITRNAAEAAIWGIEIEAQALPYERGFYAISIGYLDAEFDDFPNVVDDITGGVRDLSGNTLVNAPDWTVNLIVEPWRWQLWNGELTPRAQFRYEASAFLRVHNQPFDKRGSFTKTDVSLSYEADDGRWYARAFANNLENKNIVTSTSAGTVVIGLGPSHKANFAAPRTYGATLGMRL